MTLAKKLTEVANNRPKLYNKGALDYSPQETVSGEAIGITDISPIEHNMAVSVRGKQIIPYPYFDKTKTVGGITFTDNGDGSITINGTAGSTSEVFFLTNSHSSGDIGNLFEDGKTYTILPIGGVAVFVLNATNLADNKDVYYYGGNTFTVDKSKYRYKHVRLQVTNKTADNVTVYPMLNEGTVALPYAPYIEDISTVKLYKGGKNLIPFPYYNKSQTKNGVTFTIEEDGTINANGTATALIQFNLYIGGNLLLPNVKYTLSGCTNGSNNSYDLRVSDNKTTAYACFSKAETFSYADTSNIVVAIKISSGAVLNNVVFKPMLAVSGSADYEPYIEPTVYDVPTNGVVEGVTSLYPSTTLYTDTNGAVIDCTYYQDGRKVKENLTDMILSLGGVINE